MIDLLIIIKSVVIILIQNRAKKIKNKYKDKNKELIADVLSLREQLEKITAENQKMKDNFEAGVEQAHQKFQKIIGDMETQLASSNQEKDSLLELFGKIDIKIDKLFKEVKGKP